MKTVTVQTEYDHEVRALVATLNQAYGHDVAMVIDDPLWPFDLAETIVPHNRNGICWEQSVTSDASSVTDSCESNEDRFTRVYSALMNTLASAAIDDEELLLFGSDDFFGVGVLCERRVAPAVLQAWLPLPHAIFIVDEDASICFIVTFTKAVYVFRGRGKTKREHRSAGKNSHD